MRSPRYLPARRRSPRYLPARRRSPRYPPNWSTSTSSLLLLLRPMI
ncbi:hypothetical protein GDO81_022304 [Engystomops pustulosus]|uniref:Uncharacterized protein n=1 Tax=Engystomops pustulosus TaxID=76066 RepID=A0AAV6ZF88_ENGPU|nr:hypothetical protein GDO81_022304 [Engystomops pustulosus]